MWNIQEDISLKEYVILYSGATVTVSTADNKMFDIKLVKYGELDKELEAFTDTLYWRWVAEQTKESRFMPCLTNNKVNVGFIFNTESAILFGMPSCFIEGILVSREYENDSDKLEELKRYFPNCYIANLDGIVIKE